MLLQGMHNASASFGPVAELVVAPPGVQPQASAASGTSCRCKCATGNKGSVQSPGIRFCLSIQPVLQLINGALNLQEHQRQGGSCGLGCRSVPDPDSSTAAQGERWAGRRLECPAFMRDHRCARTTGLRCRALDANTIAIRYSHVHRIEAAKVKAVAVQLLGGSDLKWPDEQTGVGCSISRIIQW